MERIYEISGVSRQNYFKRKQVQNNKEELENMLLDLTLAVRKDHPMMSARKIHKKLNFKFIGINNYEKFASRKGLNIQVVRNKMRTTYRGNISYPNLTNRLIINNINQLWVSDITYFIINGKTFYIVFILDVYSREILGFKASDNLLAINNLNVLKQALKTRGIKNYKESLIHHSDKGSQYGSNSYRETLEMFGIRISMANNCLENAYAERINGIIKNEYLIYKNINNLKEMERELKKAVLFYNNERPHKELNYLCPTAYEKQILIQSKEERKIMELYDFQKN